MFKPYRQLPDPLTRRYLPDRFERGGDKTVALLAQAAHDGATIDGRLGCKDSKSRDLPNAMRRVRRGDQELRRHAPDAGACRPGETVVDQQRLGAGLPRSALRGEARRPGSDNCDIATQIGHSFVLSRALWTARQTLTYKFDGLADEVGEPAGEAGMLKRLDGPAQGFAVLDGNF